VDNEKAVIAAVQSGEAEAFGALVRAHQTRVRLVCLAFLGSAAEADDAAQDVFVNAFRGLAEFKGDASFGTWIARIADNHCRDVLRKRARRRTESLDALFESQGDAFDGFLSRAQTADTPPPYKSEDLELLGRLFAALPEDDREILTLSEVEELPYAEIAQRLSCSLDAVKGRLKRARQTLIDKCRKFF
jgi:RNA polymerase sigma-70 factor (ECF subfamily)